MTFQSKHLLGLERTSAEDILTILDTAKSFREVLDRPIKRLPTLQGKTVVNLFYEPSTRTRISFELAEKRMSADIVNFSASTSSVKKGETLIDTVKNIEAMKIDMVVVRLTGYVHYPAKAGGIKRKDGGIGRRYFALPGGYVEYTGFEQDGRQSNCVRTIHPYSAGDRKT
jgi:aspartate carbamoyltransferase catalytic subunit